MSTPTIPKATLMRLIDAAQGKGWRQEGRETCSLVYRDDLQIALLELLKNRDDLGDERQGLVDHILAVSA